MLLRVDVVESDDHALITAIGEIDLGTSDDVADAVADALTAGHKRVLLDFSEVTFIDSSGLAVLVRAHREAESAQAAFSVVHPTPQTLKLIRVLGLDQLLNVYDSREQALSQP
jgi:anti-anti-sigma factor